MKYRTVAMMIATLPLLCVSGVRAQDNPASAPAAHAAHPDEIVRMRQQVAAANREYDREVAAAKKVYDHKKAEAKKKRDAAVAVAHQGVD
ncbi:hypothetical protein [Paraburkholderia sp.]|uniref:hypothetical protein n=1 Tax=Paraburkholderia sp. TaxID=1926495 RepID=UPI00286F8032|nr:hypothetical protein [Paraburkholderia sp.]